MSLYWGAYAEIYITPIKNLEWYFEVDLNNGGDSSSSTSYTKNGLHFEGTSGITWYLPQL